LYDVPFKATRSSLDSWTAVTTDEVNKLINASPNKTCQLDPVPTWLVKEMRELLAPFITVTLLFNRSLFTGCFPSEFKQVIVRPRIRIYLRFQGFMIGGSLHGSVLYLITLEQK